jgi:ATP-dependent Clp protease ATP-binding subunit ClpC
VSSLAERVRQQPLCLVLLDEIEKAHPEVFDLLLGVLGEGRLDDSLGRSVDFRMALLVMTSNMGRHRHRAGGLRRADRRQGSPAAVRDASPAGVFNRLDHVLAFRRLSLDDVRRIVDLELAHVAARTGSCGAG